MHLRSAALTDIGRIRRYNEDRLLRDETLNLYGVADGVGGLPGGAEAAQCAIDIIHRGVQTSNGEPDLERITLEANQAVAQLGFRLSPHFGIGTTLTFGSFRAGKLHLAHVGDSRCYCWRKEQLEALTIDHSVENEARAPRQGRIDLGQRATAQRAHAMHRANRSARGRFERTCPRSRRSVFVFQ